MPLVVPILYGIRKHLSRTNFFEELVVVAGEEAYVVESEVMMNDCRKFIAQLFDQHFSKLVKKSELV